VSRRKQLIRRTLLWCSAPVILAGAWVVRDAQRGSETYVAGTATEGITRDLDRSVEGGASPLAFTDVTAAAGIAFAHFPFPRTQQLPEDMGSGAAWADYDGDGNVDLFLVNFAAPLGTPAAEMAASPAADHLYRNRGDGTFEDVTEASGVGRAHRGMGAAWADYDGDGDADLFVTSWGSGILWRNRGDGTFEDVTEAARVAERGFWSGATWSDFDRDGDLDLYVCGYVKYDEQDPAQLKQLNGDAEFPFTLNPSSWPPHENRLYVNDGHGSFTDRAAAAGVLGEAGRSLSAAWADFDADGWPDLYVANDVSDNAMYRNLGDGTFRNVSYEAIVADYRGAMGIAVGDWDRDQDLDLFITHWIAQENALYSSLVSDLRNDDGGGSLMYVDDADRVGLGQIALDLIGWGTSFADFDNDGWLDLFVANGSTFQKRGNPAELVPMDPHLFWNRGKEEGFFEVGEAAGIRTKPPGVGRGAAFADYDGDGDVDILVCRNRGPARLLRNDSRGGHSLSLRFASVSGHPSASGARIRVHAGELTLLRDAAPGPSYLSQSATDLSVGLGDATRADSVEVDWLSGAHDVYRDLASGRVWLLTEGGTAREVAAFGPGGTGAAGAAAAASPRTASEAGPLSGRREGQEHAVRADVTTNLSREDTRRFWELKRDANRLLLDREWREAIAVLDEMLRLDPNHLDSLYSLGNCHLELGEYAQAVDAWERLTRVNPASSRAWLQIGLTHSLPGAGNVFDLAAAAHAFRTAHELNEEESGALIRWGEAELARGRREEAERIFTSAYGMNDMATSAYYLAGYLAWKRGDDARAGELLGEAVRTLGGEGQVHAATSEGDIKSGKLAEYRREAASRRLFSDCLDALHADGAAAAPETAFARVDEALARLASR
jgi:enediyne biosynthesis protein E4